MHAGGRKNKSPRPVPDGAILKSWLRRGELHAHERSEECTRPSGRRTQARRSRSRRDRVSGTGESRRRVRHGWRYCTGAGVALSSGSAGGEECADPLSDSASTLWNAWLSHCFIMIYWICSGVAIRLRHVASRVPYFKDNMIAVSNWKPIYDRSIHPPALSDRDYALSI